MSIFRGISSVRGLNRLAVSAPAAAHVNPVPAAGEIVFTTNFSAGSYFASYGGYPSSSRSIVLTSTNYYKIEWWDGTSQVVAPTVGAKYVYAGVGSSIFGTNAEVPFKLVTSSYDGTPKDVRIYSCNSSGVKSGYITGIQFDRNSISFIDLSQASNLTHVSLNSQQVAFMYTGQYYNSSDVRNLTINLSNASSIQHLSVFECGLVSTAIDLTDCSSLLSLGIGWNPFADYTIIDPVRTQLEGLQAGGFSTTYADLGGMTSLITLWMFSSTEEVIDITNCANLRTVKAQTSPNLHSIYATGVGGAMNYSTYSTYSSFGSGFNIASCNFGSLELDALYSDLEYGSGVIIVNGNPGTDTDTPSIATAKGYTVFGS